MMFQPRRWALALVAMAGWSNASGADTPYQQTVALLGEARCPMAVNELSCLAEAALTPDYYHYDWQASDDGTPVSATSSDQLSWINAAQATDNLDLPQVQLLLQSDASHWLLGGALSYQAYQWQGQATTLTFNTQVDFALSGGRWGTDFNSQYAAWIGAFGEVADDPAALLPQLALDHNLDAVFGANQASYNSLDDMMLSDNGGSGQHSLSFDLAVVPGEQFYLAGVVIGRAMNGGWVASDQSLNSLLSATDLSAGQLQQHLQIIGAPNQVPVPATWLLTLFGLALLARRRLYQSITNRDSIS